VPSQQQLPDNALVVRCGKPPFEGPNSLHGRCLEHEGYYGFSVQSAAGVNIEVLATWCRNNKIGLTTVGKIRSEGYDVVITRGNGHHATVVVPRTWDIQAALTLGALFEECSNPVPNDERLR
jgi:hypothetical protein